MKLYEVSNQEPGIHLLLLFATDRDDLIAVLRESPDTYYHRYLTQQLDALAPGVDVEEYEIERGTITCVGD